MIKLGFLGCGMLQDEIIHLIKRDSHIKHVTLVKNGEEGSISEKLKQNGILFSEKTIDQLELEKTDKKFDEDFCSIEIIIWVLEIGLHEFPKILKENVYKVIEIFRPHVDGILLFYGLCGNVLGKVEQEMSTCKCAVWILRDDNNEVVDDCIGATLEGRKNYQNLLKSFHGVGTLIFTPMFAAATDEFFERNMRKTGLSEEQAFKMNKYMFDECGYRYVGKLKTGLEYTKDFDANIRRFAERYGFEIKDVGIGSQVLFEKNYDRIKKHIRENKKMENKIK